MLDANEDHNAGVTKNPNSEATKSQNTPVLGIITNTSVERNMRSNRLFGIYVRSCQACEDR